MPLADDFHLSDQNRSSPQAFEAETLGRLPAGMHKVAPAHTRNISVGDTSVRLRASKADYHHQLTNSE